MKYLRLAFLCLVSCAICAAQTALAQTNVLRVDTVKAPAGKAVSIAVVMENQSDVTGIQFDIDVPYELAVDEEGVIVAKAAKQRIPNHTVTVQKKSSPWRSYYPDGIGTGSQGMTYQRYRVIVYSERNELAVGTQGTLLTLQLTTTDNSLKNNALLPVYLENVTLTDPQKQDLPKQTVNGAIVIEEIPRPDLTPANVTVTPNSVSPGGKMTVSWQVSNIGLKATDDGWTERISLMNLAGTITKTVATTYYDQALAAGGMVTRQTEIELPQNLGLDGICYVQVEVVPTDKTGEHPSMRDNNTANSANITLTKHISLELSKTRFTEGTQQRVMAKLSRSGSWTLAQTFQITTAPEDPRVDIQNSVTIPAGQSGVVFYFNVLDNDVVDEDSIVTITVKHADYTSVSQQIVIEDNEFPGLDVKASKAAVTEGESFTLTITTPRVSDSDIAVTITSEDNKRFKFPSTATIPAGKKSVDVTVETVDDELPNLEASNRFTVSAPQFSRGEAIVLLQDNDMPVLTLTLTPNQVSEAGGPTAVQAVLTRTGKTTNKITIKVSDNADGALYYSNKTLEMAPGVETVYFNLGPVDNTLQDGDRTFELTAAVWVSSCSCSSSGEQAGHVSAQLTVLDNDGPALTVASEAATVKEGSSTTLTIGRNTTDNSQPLTVSLAANDDTDLTYPKSVTIPAGQQSTTVTVETKKNAVSDDSRTIIFTVKADGYGTGTCFLLITDQTQPDARIESLTANAASAVVGSTVTLYIKVVNDGASLLAAGTPVTLYKQGSSQTVGKVTTKTNIGIGGSETIERKVALPEEMGTHTYYAVVNEQQTVKELVYTNNKSAELSIVATSPFTATASTDKSVYRQGETVTVSGQLKGDLVANTDVEVYMVNDGIRETKTTKTDAVGNYTLDWQLYSLQSGHFVVGACYPSDPTTAAMAEFDVYGLKRADNSYITCDVTCGEAYNGTIRLVNAGTLPLTGVTAEAVDVPDGCSATFTVQPSIEGGEEVELAYSFTGSVPSEGNNWIIFQARVTSSEGAFLEVPFYYYARTAKGNLVVKSQNLVTTMNKDNGRDYSFQVMNTGKGNTGKLSLSLPQWMSALTGTTMPALNQNDTATVVLRMMPTSDMQLNVPVTGRLGINCENGNGTYINFTVTPVSDVKGTLVIDVCDEYTYYTDAKPHVSGATIEVCNPVSGALVAEGTSDTDGLYSVELPEGYYQVKVTADKHDRYKNTILIDPGTTTTKVVNLSYQAIGITWDVEETEVEDVYNIVTTVTYETNVPTPVVECIVPDRIAADQLGEGESLVFYAVLTNKGLITSQNTAFRIPEEAGGCRWEPLSQYENIPLAPQQSVVIPIKVTRMPASESRVMKASGDNGCHTVPRIVSEWECGPDGKYHEYKKTIQYRDCPANPNSGKNEPGHDDGPGYPLNGSDEEKLFEYESTGVRVIGSDDCSWCNDQGTKTVIDCLASFVPGGGGCGYGLTTGAATIASGNAGFIDYFTTITTGIGCGLEVAGAAATGTGAGAPAGALLTGIGIGINLLNCTVTLVNACVSAPSGGGPGNGPGFGGAASAAGANDNGNGDTSRAMMRKVVAGQPSYMTRFSEISRIKLKNQVGYFGYISEVLGDTLWLYETSLEEMYNVVNTVQKQNGKVSMATMKSVQPEGISDAMYQKFIDRVNNTADYDVTKLPVENMIHAEEILKYLNLITEAHNEAVALGYSGIDEMWSKESEIYLTELEKGHGSVCSTISLQIEQTMTMTRQAFRGTLTVFNGNESTAMTDVKLRLTVTNVATGEQATSREFAINAEKLKGFEGILDMESGWTLAGNATGTATILFIPSKFAAPETGVDYAFGGTLSYIDPFTGLEVHRDLSPVTLTVKPSPELDLTYFMQRDIYGDDALTEAVEPMVPAEFAVILNNKGFGDATNVRMVTKQPQIIDNEKGLYINFEFVSSQLNGQEKTLALGETIPTEFGTIPAHSQAYAQWWLQSSLLGHFIDYQIEATHVTSYGNENLSLLDQVTIHELIHGFTPMVNGQSSIVNGQWSMVNTPRAFLVNDVTDSYDLPDQVYFTDGTQADVAIAANAVVTKTSATEYTLTVTPQAAGWNYGSVLDPTAGKQQLIGVVRQRDNAVMPMDNVWQTDRDLTDGKDWDYVNRLHFVADIPADVLSGSAAETFLLTFEERPDIELQVESYAGVPAEGTLQTTPLKEVTVKFNKAINAETFTTDDIVLACQGTRLDASQITVTALSDSEFKLDLAQLTAQNGYYVLTVQTSEITDFEGFRGATGRQASWVQFAGGKVMLTINAQPAEGGTVTPASGSYEYGQAVTLTAKPNTGYEFVRWTDGKSSTLDGQPSMVDGQWSMVYTPTDNQMLTAVFQKVSYDITIAYDEKGGRVENGGSGKYTYGTTLTLTATPNAGYGFDGWKVDGELKSKERKLTLTVSAATTIEALFSELASAKLTGRVTAAADDTPVAGAVITLVSGNVAYTATTNSLGRYSIEVTEKALNYNLRCEAKGFMWSSDQTIWFTDTEETKDFALLRGATVMLPDNGIYTFSSTSALDFGKVKSLRAYYAPACTGTDLILHGVGITPAGAGLVIRCNAGGKRVDIPEANASTIITGNLLIGTAQGVYTTDRNDVYVLPDGPGMKKVFEQADYGVKVPLASAYVQYATTVQPETLNLLIVGDMNDDGLVDAADIAAIIDAMNNAPMTPGKTDVNGDGVTNVADILTVITIMQEQGR